MDSPPVRRGAQLAVLTVAAGAAAFARTTLSPLQEATRLSLDASDNQMALLQGPALAVPMMLCAIPLGLVVDRYSRVRVISALALINVIGGLLSASASHFLVLFAARSLVGLTAPATGMTALSLIADWYTAEQRGRAGMVMAIGQVGGMSAAFLAGGALLEWLTPNATAWRWSMLWMTAPLVLTALLTLVLREPPRSGLRLEHSPARGAFRQMWRYRQVIAPLLVGQVMVGMADAAVVVWTAPTLSRTFSLPPARMGAAMAVALFVSGVLGPLGGGVLADRGYRTGGPARSVRMLAILAALSVPAALFPVAPTVASAIALLGLFLTVGYAISVVVGTLFTIVVPNELRGLCLATSVTASLLFVLGIAPVAVSAMSAAIGGPGTIGRALACVCFITSVLAAAVFVSAMRNYRQPEPAMQHAA